MFAGEIIGISASLRIGIAILAAPEFIVPEIEPRRVVLGGLERVGQAPLRASTTPGLRGRVVERLVRDRVRSGLAAGLLERELRAVDDRLRLDARGALQRERGVDLQRLPGLRRRAALS